MSFTQNFGGNYFINHKPSNVTRTKRVKRNQTVIHSHKSNTDFKRLAKQLINA